MNHLFRETLSAVLQGIGWTIGMAICGFAFVAFHLLIWPVLILTLPVTISFFGGAHTSSVSDGSGSEDGYGKRCARIMDTRTRA